VVGPALFYGALFMVLYMAVEPYARRIWPSVLVSWSRLVGRKSRNWRDPLLGRSVLGGLVAGTVLLFVDYLAHVVLGAVQGGPVKPQMGNWDVLLGQRYALAEILETFLVDTILDAFVLAFLLVVAKVVLRRTWLAVVAAGLVSAIMSGFEIMSDFAMSGFAPSTPGAIVIAAIVVQTAVRIGVLLRFGLVGICAAVAVSGIGPLTRTADWTAWHSQPAIMAIVAVAALAAYGYWAATAGKRFVAEA